MGPQRKEIRPSQIIRIVESKHNFQRWSTRHPTDDSHINTVIKCTFPSVFPSQQRYHFLQGAFLDAQVRLGGPVHAPTASCPCVRAPL